MNLSVKRSKAFMNLHGYEFVEFNDVTSSSSRESMSDVLVIEELQQSASVTSVHSLDASASNNNLLLAPSVSVSSLLERSQAAAGYHVNEPMEDDKIKFEVQHDGLGFTRDELKNRLSNLIKYSVKHFNSDPDVNTALLSQLNIHYRLLHPVVPARQWNTQICIALPRRIAN